MSFESTATNGFPFDRIYGGRDFTVYPDGQTTDMGLPPVKLLILGNSITFSPINFSTYWFGMWGMAASAPECDYAHRLALRIANRLQKAVSVKTAACWLWERDFATFNYSLLSEHRDFHADYFIYRAGDNIPGAHPDIAVLGASIGTLIDYVAAAHVVVTGTFYQQPTVDAIAHTTATVRGLPFTSFLDMFADPLNHANGHRNAGVAVHPSDLAHAEFARRVFIAGETGGLW